MLQQDSLIIISNILNEEPITRLMNSSCLVLHLLRLMMLKIHDHLPPDPISMGTDTCLVIDCPFLANRVVASHYMTNRKYHFQILSMSRSQRTWYDFLVATLLGFFLLLLYYHMLYAMKALFQRKIHFKKLFFARFAFFVFYILLICT